MIMLKRLSFIAVIFALLIVGCNSKGVVPTAKDSEGGADKKGVSTITIDLESGYNLLTEKGVADFLRDYPEEKPFIEQYIQEAKDSMKLPTTEISLTTKSLPTANLSATNDWMQVATERQTFPISGTKIVRYGAGLHWIMKEVTTSGYCGTWFWGNDPAPGFTKVCQVYIGSEIKWNYVVSEGESFRAPSRQWVRYGANGSYEKTMVPANTTFWCVHTGISDSTIRFTRDPAPGIVKQCDVLGDGLPLSPAVLGPACVLKLDIGSPYFGSNWDLVAFNTMTCNRFVSGTINAQLGSTTTYRYKAFNFGIWETVTSSSVYPTYYKCKDIKARTPSIWTQTFIGSGGGAVTYQGIRNVLNGVSNAKSVTITEFNCEDTP